LSQLWIAKRPENSITLAFNPGRLIDDDRIAGVRVDLMPDEIV
jgi:hypothetical protein